MASETSLKNDSKLKILGRFRKKKTMGEKRTPIGCGSSREHAPLAIKAVGISCIIAKTFARIFYRNAFNIGLPILECSDGPDQIEEGQEIEVDLNTGQIKDLLKGPTFQAKPIPPFMQDLIWDGGLMNHLAKRLSQGKTSVQRRSP